MARQKIPAADVLFSSREKPGAEHGPAAPKNVKVTVYMLPELVAVLDETRAALRRDGITVDRSRMLRAAVNLANTRPELWRAAIIDEEN